MIMHGYGALLPVERVQCGYASLHTPTMYDGHARRCGPHQRPHHAAAFLDSHGIPADLLADA